MKVIILVAWNGTEDDQILGVYSSYEKATEAMNKFKTLRPDRFDHFDTVPMFMDVSAEI